MERYWPSHTTRRNLNCAARRCTRRCTICGCTSHSTWCCVQSFNCWAPPVCLSLPSITNATTTYVFIIIVIVIDLMFINWHWSHLIFVRFHLSIDSFGSWFCVYGRQRFQQQCHCQCWSASRSLITIQITSHCMIASCFFVFVVKLPDSNISIVFVTVATYIPFILFRHITSYSSKRTSSILACNGEICFKDILFFFLKKYKIILIKTVFSIN